MTTTHTIQGMSAAPAAGDCARAALAEAGVTWYYFGANRSAYLGKNGNLNPADWTADELEAIVADMRHRRKGA